MTLSTTAIAQALAFTLSDNLLAPDNNNLLATVGGVLPVPLTPVIGIGLGLYGCYSVIKENSTTKNLNGCDFLMSFFEPNLDNLDMLKFKNAAYIRVVGTLDDISTDHQLFYVNRAQQKCIEIKLNRKKLDLFDREVKMIPGVFPGTKSLTYNQLRNITKITGHLHLIKYDPEDPLELIELCPIVSMVKNIVLIATNSFAFHLFLAGVSASVWLPISAVGFAANSSVELLRSILLLCDFNLHETRAMGVNKQKELTGELVISLFKTMAAGLVVLTGVSHLPLVFCCLGVAMIVRTMLKISPGNHQDVVNEHELRILSAPQVS